MAIEQRKPLDVLTRTNWAALAGVGVLDGEGEGVLVTITGVWELAGDTAAVLRPPPGAVIRPSASPTTKTRTRAAPAKRAIVGRLIPALGRLIPPLGRLIRR